MQTSNESIEDKLKKIPIFFKLLAKKELKKALTQHKPLLVLDIDTIYINIARGTTVSSENLTEALLKKSLGEETLLSDPLAGLYSNPEGTNLEDRIQGLEVRDLENIIDDLSIEILNNYREHMDSFWESKEVPIPQELYVDPVDNFLKSLVENSSLINRAYQVDNSYPTLKQTVVSYLSQKLKGLYKKDINPDTVSVLILNKGKENPSPIFLYLTDFVLTGFSSFFFFYSHLFLLENTIRVEIDQNTKNIAFSEIFQENDILLIKSKHQARLDAYWGKNSTNYRILAKFSYLKALFEQQDSTLKLSEKSLKLALQAIGLTEEEMQELTDFNEIDPKEIPLNILETLSDPKNIEVSSLVFNKQIASDILKICDPETKELLIYIPGYTPSFVEAKNENILFHWIFHQAESPDNLSSIASHFSHSSRMVDNTKLDAFLYSDYVEQGADATEKIASGDIFSFITEQQKERLVADLYINKISVPLYTDSIPDYRSADSAFFITIAAALQYTPHLLPNIHKTSNDLYELLPSPYKTASELIKKGIKDKLHIDIDPDKTFISFSLHEVKPVSRDPNIPLVRGQEASTAIQSLTEATLSNYQAGYSLLGFTTIIYQDLSGKREYTANAQLLNILPKDVEEIIQKADLDTLHKVKLDSFWNKHADQVKYFYQDRYLQQALEVHLNKALSADNLQIIVDVAFCSLSLEEAVLSGLINPHIRIEIVSVDSYQSTDMFVFRDTSKQKVVLYISGNQEAFFSFTNYETCICFLEEKGKTNAEWQKLLTSHFSMDVQDVVLSALKRGSYVDPSSLASVLYPRPADCSFSNTHIRHPITTKPIEKSLFEVIQKNSQKRSYLDANAVIVSDRELMLKRIIGIAESIYLALLVPSVAFPILNWISLVALVAEASINLYLAKNADTVKERHLAALSAGFNTLELLLMGFLTPRSLKFSKNQHLSDQQAGLRAIGSGKGVQTSLNKAPISEEIFFDTTKTMSVWAISSSNTLFNHLDVKAWFLGERFLLFTGKISRAKHLIISSDGGYFFGSGIVKVPKSTELVVLGPHGWSIFDPRTENIAKRVVLPYGIINENTALPTQTAFFPSLFSRSPNMHFHPKEVNIKMLAGTKAPGHIRNYSLSKYQTFETGGESYLDIAQIINSSRHPFPNIYGIGFNPVDVLTIRNRRGRPHPNLEDVFKSLQSHGIHYDRITLEFCRSKMSLLSKTQPSLNYKPTRFY
ncbi:DUF6543 domain-containing protein [Candidatus Rhabdochlamydia sp. T3358]|uniref:dermonecrotic toxin domain-containing protein n=1 Tax=Candidatus Rhabdochlamydia sp. T3358 TaxID=2099795 RepID=UPI0010B8C6A5|nr:DUF6543 domain-containing protein [Candidatus Rhabdochlamydia sp. T3358]VHO03123.1 hypothetical protein RHT_00738 [Candidatus Rhabdochlamydia sp. T3358]